MALNANPNLDNPVRLAPSQALTCSQNHSYGPEQSAFDGGLMDKFVQFTTGSSCTQSTTPDRSSYGPTGIVMDYYDGNTVTAMWNYAQHFSLNDYSRTTRSSWTFHAGRAETWISGQTQRHGPARRHERQRRERHDDRRHRAVLRPVQQLRRRGSQRRRQPRRRDRVDDRQEHRRPHEHGRRSPRGAGSRAARTSGN